jgi:hypothetical protein
VGGKGEGGKRWEEKVKGGKGVREEKVSGRKRCQERVKKCVSRSGEWKWQSRKASESLGVRLSAEDVACDRLYQY